MTEPETPTETDEVRRARTGLQIAERRSTLESMRRDMATMHQRLIDQGFTVRLSDGELRHSHGLVYSYSYAGGEFVARLTDRSGGSRRQTFTFLITDSLLERQPAAIDTLGEVLLRIAQGNPYQVEIEAGHIAVGLVCDGLTFGDRVTTGG